MRIESNEFLSRVGKPQHEVGEAITVVSGVVARPVMLRTMYLRTYSKYFFFIIMIIFNRN